MELQAAEPRCANLLTLQGAKFRASSHSRRHMSSRCTHLTGTPLRKKKREKKKNKRCRGTRGTALLNVAVHNIMLRRPDWSAAPQKWCSICPENRRFGKVPRYLATARNTLTEWRRPTEIIIITQLPSAGHGAVPYDLRFPLVFMCYGFSRLGK